jgi:hypothetical protein
MNLITEPYSEQVGRWPATGRHILAQYDDSSIVVYQAYRPAIGLFAARHGYFGGDFSLSRMSWIKTNFLWMQYRSGWSAKPDQEVTLAIRLQRTFFDELLTIAVHSTYKADIYGSKEDWKRQVASSEVRLQWDPDHHPSGAKLERRALQLGLRGEALAHYARTHIIEIEDISAFVREQHYIVQSKGYNHLLMPRETVYPAPTGAAHVQLSSVSKTI